MGDASDRSRVLSEVERLQGHFMYLNEELSLIVELLALEGEGRDRISELCSDAKVDLRKKGEDLDNFREKYLSNPPKADGDALVLASTCAPLIAMEIAALDLFVEALAVAEHVEVDDLPFVDEALRTARSVYNTHVSFVQSALTFQGQDLVAFAEFCNSDPGTSASREAFDQLTNIDLPRFRARVTAHASD